MTNVEAPAPHLGWHSRGYVPHWDHPGACWLRRPEIAALVEGALVHFDTQRYQLLAWCVMPNHVHALIETKVGWPLDGVLHSWKSFTSHEAGKILHGAAGETPALPGRERWRPAGEFWQREYLDRYLRNAEHYANVLAYIEENPVKAGLAKIKTGWPWSSARFRTAGTAGVPPARITGVDTAPSQYWPQFLDQHSAR